MSIIYHIDLNAFFATAEINKNPSLADKPVAVGGHGRKGVISTANYIARKYGVHSAMPVFEALKLCPDLVVVHGDYELYDRLSGQFMDIIKSYTSKVEQASIDECYADMSEIVLKYKKPLDLAIDIQKRVKHELGLTCSIGIAPNKFLAKIASDLKKPNGITVLRKREVKSKLWPLSIDAIGGIGKKTAPHLKQQGIKTIGDLANPENKAIIEKILGNTASSFIDYANGIDNSDVCDYHEMKSMSQSTTTNEDILDFNEVKNIFSGLIKTLSSRLKEEYLWGNSISISIRYNTFQTISRTKKLDYYTNSYEEILSSALMLFEMNDRGEPIRLLGVGVNNLKNQSTYNDVDLFDYNKINPTDELIDEINSKLHQSAVIKASDLIVKSKNSTTFNGIYKR